MQPFLLIKQTLEVAYDPGPLLLAGTNAGFSAASEMFWRGTDGLDPEFSVGLLDTDNEFNELTFGQAAHGVDLLRMAYRPPGGEEAPAVLVPGQTALEQALGALDRTLRDFIKSRQDQNFTISVARSRCFVEIRFDDLPGGWGPYTALQNICTSLLHLPGLRDNPARFYPATQVGEVFPGVFQPYVASVIQSWSDLRDDRLKELGRQLQLLGLTWKVETKRIDDTRVALRVGRLPRSRQGGARDLVNIVDVGLGVSQTLPVLVALLLAQSGQFVFLEQPEIHLHPRAQVALADIVLDASTRGVRVVVETHSYLLLRAIQEAAVRRELPASSISLNWFSRDPDGRTHVDSTRLSADGTFGDWPNDFADVEMEVEDRYLQAVLARTARS